MLPHIFGIGDHVLVRLHAKRQHKLEPIKSRSMRIITSISTHVICGGRTYAGKTGSCSCSKNDSVHCEWQMQGPSTPINGQAAYLKSTYHLVNQITGVKKSEYGNCVRIRLSGFDEIDDQTWEPLGWSKEDVSRPLGDYLRTAVERNLKPEILDLYF